MRFAKALTPFDEDKYMFTCGFFNSVNGDRKYNSEQISAIFDGLITEGVLAHCGEKFSVSPGNGMNVIVGSGRCWFSHKWGLSDGNNIIAISPSDPTHSRMDAIVIEMDLTDEIRNGFLKVITGTISATPAKPTLIKNDSIAQWPIAYITIPANASSISTANIQNIVGTSECPYVTSILESVSIDSLFSQWEGEFDEWFDNITSQLSGNVATNLQNQIDQLSENLMPLIGNGIKINTIIDSQIFHFENLNESKTILFQNTVFNDCLGYMFLMSIVSGSQTDSSSWKDITCNFIDSDGNTNLKYYLGSFVNAHSNYSDYFQTSIVIGIPILKSGNSIAIISSKRNAQSSSGDTPLHIKVSTYDDNSIIPNGIRIRGPGWYTISSNGIDISVSLIIFTRIE